MEVRSRKAVIDDFAVGQHATFTKTFTEADVEKFIEVTGDVNPLHVDDAFAAQTPFGSRVQHGMLTASLFFVAMAVFLPWRRVQRRDPWRSRVRCIRPQKLRTQNANAE